MLGRFHLGEDGGDFSLSIDHECCPFGPHVFLSIHRLLDPDAVRLNDRFIRVAEKGEGKFEFRDEFFMGFYRIDTDAEKMGPRRLDLRPGIPDPAGLSRAARRVVLWVKVEHDRSAFQIRES